MDPAAPLTEIAEKLRDNKLILFIGSGMSSPYYPTWSQLLDQLRNVAFTGKRAHSAGAREVAKMIQDGQYLEAALAIQMEMESGEAWRDFIANKFEDKPRDTSPQKKDVDRRYEALKGLPFAGFITTNYDPFLSIVARSSVTHEDKAADLARLPRDNTVLKLHGDVAHPGTLILNAADFAAMKHGRKEVGDFMNAAARNCSFLFLGYSFSDDDVLWWLERARFEAGSNIEGHFGVVDIRKWKPDSFKTKLMHHRYGVKMVEAPLYKVGAKEYPDIEKFLHQLHEAYQKAKAGTVTLRFDKQKKDWPEEALYVSPEIVTRKGKARQNLDDYLREWLKAADRRFLIVLGEFGTGKTQFSFRAERLVRENTSRRPVLLRLGDFIDGASKDDLASAAMPDNSQGFLDALKIGELVLILDAFDEMGKAKPGFTPNENFKHLTKDLVEGKAKVILTCRKEFFRDDDREREMLEDYFKASDKVSVSPDDAEIVDVQRFDADRICRALEKRGKPHLFAKFKDNERLVEIASRPMLMDLICKYPEDRLGKNTHETDLYREHIDESLRRPNDGEKHKRLEFAGEVAWEMQNSAKALSRQRLEEMAKAKGVDPDYLLSRSLLVRHVNDFAFGHRSFQEFLVAERVWKRLERDDRSLECKLSDPTIRFIRELLPAGGASFSLPAGFSRPIEGMLWIPPGPFIFGEANTARIANLQHGFWLDQYPVTNQQFLDFLLQTGKKNIDKSWIDHDRSRITKSLTLSNPKYVDHPVTGVSWHGATAFAQAAGKRLPTEEEWEKAARGIDGRRYPWGDEFVKENANTSESGLKDTSPVTQYAEAKSPYGVVDMAGNVFEWTASEEGPLRILRGGSWDYDPEVARCAFRVRDLPEYAINFIGFRCART